MSNVFVSTCVVILSSYHPMFFAFTKEGEKSRERDLRVILPA